jgi:hypothetical protein
MTCIPPRNEEINRMRINQKINSGEKPLTPLELFAARLAAAALLSLTMILGVLGLGCGTKDAEKQEEVEIEGAKNRDAMNVKLPKVRFTDITAKSGIRFTHTSGRWAKFEHKLLPETMGSGVAFIDYDKDGKPDLLFVNSCYWPGHEDKSKPAPTLAFYRNKGKGEFEDITEKVGLKITMYGMGVTVGDFDNDGWPDIFITGVGGNRLFRNVEDKNVPGGRKFVDVTKDAGDLNNAKSWPTGGGDFVQYNTPISFPSSAAFLDYDGDGLLDLFVCNYVTWSPQYDLDQGFTLKGVGRAYGAPIGFQGTHCRLYRNLGNGKFKDVTAEAGIEVTGERGEAVGKSLGVIVCDVDDDGWPDIIVANDTVRNFLFHNQGNGKFKEVGREVGVAYPDGQTRGAMGIDWGEYRPGRFGAVIGNFANEPNTLLRLDGGGVLNFRDVASTEGLAGPSRIVLKFGLFFFDFDLDGLLDLLTCNGHLEPDIQLVQHGQSYKQPVQLYWNTGGKRCFEPMTAQQSGLDLFRPIVGRGCAFADINGDGYLDVVLTENGGPARLLKNEGGTGHHWIRLELEGDGKRSNTSAIGAKVTLYAGDKVQHREVVSARGYLSQSEMVLTFGLGKATKVDRVEIRWPGRNGGRQVETDLKIDQVNHIKQK